MNNGSQNNDIDKKVFEKISAGKIKMTPRLFFVLKAALFIIGGIFLMFFIIYLISFIIFSLRATGILFLPKFGFRGLGFFFNSLPWLLILISVFLIILLEIFAKKSSIVYRRPIVYSLLAIIIIISAGSFLMYQLPIHPRLFRKAQERNFSAMGMVYRDLAAPKMKNVHYGEIVNLTEGGFIIENPRGEIIRVNISSKTNIPSSVKFEIGNEVVILGERKNGDVDALGVRSVKKDFDIFPMRRIHKRRFPQK